MWSQQLGASSRLLFSQTFKASVSVWGIAWAYYLQVFKLELLGHSQGHLKPQGRQLNFGQ